MCHRRISRPGGQGNYTMDNQKNCLVLNIFIACMVWKKAAVIFNFCLIGNIHHSFLVPRMIESAPKTSMPIQTPDLNRVLVMPTQLSLIQFHRVQELRPHQAVKTEHISWKFNFLRALVPKYIEVFFDKYVWFIPLGNHLIFS